MRFTEWCAYWASLTDEERAEELRMMDAYAEERDQMEREGESG